MSHITKPEVVLFDWDNTLIDSWERSQATINHVYRHFQMPELSLEEVKNRPQVALRDSFPQVFGDRWREAYTIYYDTYAKIHLEYLSPHEGAEELLAYIHDQNIYMAVVSNKLGRNLRKEIAHLGWEHYFKEAIGAEDTPTSKPNKEPAEKALYPSLHAQGPQIWFVGDSSVDMECAKHLNATPIFIGHEDFLPEAIRINPSLIHKNNLKDLIKLIKSAINQP